MAPARLLREPISALRPRPELPAFARQKQTSGLFSSGLIASPYGWSAPLLEPSSIRSRRRSDAIFVSQTA